MCVCTEKGVEAFYREKNSKQTVAFVESMERKYSKATMGAMGLWECLEFLDSFVDNSDPDTEHSQVGGRATPLTPHSSGGWHAC